MDAIRNNAMGTPDAVTQPDRTRKARSPKKAGAKRSAPSPAKAAAAADKGQTPGAPRTDTVSGVAQVLHFHDQRPPHEIQFALERDLMVLFTPSMDNGQLIMRTHARLTGVAYFFELRFDAALPRKNCYSWRVEITWDKKDVTYHDYYRKSAGSWFSFWTRHFVGAPPSAAGAGSPRSYQKWCDVALQAQAHPDNIPALQQAMVAAMITGCLLYHFKQGASPPLAFLVPHGLGFAVTARR